MSAYPPDDLFGYPSNHPQPGYPSNPLPPQPGYPSNPLPPQPYPNTSIPGYLPNSSYPYPNQQPTISSNIGYPVAAGYPISPPVSPPYPNAGGYPAPGNVPDSAGGVPNPEFNPAFSPTAPDLSQMEKIPDCENFTDEERIVTPPAMSDWQPDVERRQIENLPSLSEEDVREAALEYVSEHCCYGKGAAKNMVIKDITMMSAFHYKLETFTEKRGTAIILKPYSGEAIDGPENGPPPRPWSIAATPPAMFIDSEMKMELPHTAFVKSCNKCAGNGKVRCNSCDGHGKSKCRWCRGGGRISNSNVSMNCNSCKGTGSSSCWSCRGRGQKDCSTCDGEGLLKGFKELTVTWANHVDDYVSETSNLPKKLVCKVTGQTAFEEECRRVSPIVKTSDRAVCNASKEFIMKHSNAFKNERILKQRHCLRLIPIAEVNYSWKEKSGIFYVYGYEHKVYFDKYPQKCCCCTII